MKDNLVFPALGKNLDQTRASGLEIFHRVVQKIAEDLSQRRPVRDDLGQTILERHPCVFFPRLVTQGVHDSPDKLLY